MKLYTQLSKFNLLNNYTSKFLAVAFVGIHVPLIGIILFIIFNDKALSSTNIIVLTLLLTLGATGATLIVLNKLLAPLKLTRKSLKGYLENQELPDLPTHFTDEMGELMKDLQFALQTLDQLMETKQNTIAVLSHDLKSPSLTINMLADMLKKEKSEDEKHQIIEHIKTTVNEQLALISKVLENLKNEEQTQGKLHKEKLNLKKVINDVILTQHIALKDKNLRLNFNPSTELSFEGNELALKQVFTNLIHNAIKFSKINGEINILSEVLKGELKIEVIDHGIGFENKHADDLFKPFTKHGRKGTLGENSSGMGLYMSRRFISKHSGTLAAKSNGPIRELPLVLIYPIIRKFVYYLKLAFKVEGVRKPETFWLLKYTLHQ